MPWLIVLLGLGMVVSSVVGIFEKVVTNLPIIMCFQSLILDMAGNVGTQSLAVTIRVLMDESLTGKQKLELVFKEMRIGLCNGGVLGLMSFVLIGLYIWLFKGKTLIFAFAEPAFRYSSKRSTSTRQLLPVRSSLQSTTLWLLFPIMD